MKSDLYIDGVRYLSAREAADVLGYASDYISRLCREGRLRGRRSGKSWIVEADSLVPFLKAHEARKQAWHQDLSRELRSVAEPIVDADFIPLPRALVAPRQLHILRASERTHREQEAAQMRTITRVSISSFAAVLVLFVASTSSFSAYVADAVRGSTSSEQFAAVSFFSPIESIARAAYESATDIACSITGWCDEMPPMPVVYVRAPSQPIAQQPASNVTNNITNYIQPVVGSGSSMLAGGVSEQLLDSRLTAMENYLTGRIDLLAYEGQRQTEDLADDLSNGIGGGGFDDIDITDSSWSGGSIAGAAISGSTLSGITFTGAQAFDALEVTDATTTSATSTNLYVSGSFGFGTDTGLLRTTSGVASTLANGSNGQVLKMVSGNLQWSTDLTGGGGGGAGAWSTTTDDLAIYPADPTDVVIIGDSATTTVGTILEIAGDSLFRGAVTGYGNLTAPRFTATSSTASVFPYASTTALSATTLCLSTDCRTSWPTFTDTSFSTTSADYWQTQRNFFSTTSADYYTSITNFFSTTSADAWKDQRNFFSTTSASYFLAQNQGAAFSTTSADYLLSTYNKGFFFSTTSANHLLTQNGSLGFSTTSNDYWLTQRNFFSTTSADAWKDQRNFFSTTSASYFSSLGLAFSTTSADYFLSQNQDAAFSTTSANYFLTQNGSLGFSSTSANYFVSSSTTIPKTYTENTFSALQTFSNASSSIFSTDTLCISTDCRTEWPTFTDTSFSTTSADFWQTQRNFFSTTSANHWSSLGFGFSTTSADYWGSQKGYASFGYLFPNNATTTGLILAASTTIGNGSADGGLTVNGTATTSRLVVSGTATSTFAGDILMSGSIIPSIDNTYSLGSESNMWKDVYIGPGSLYVNGKKVIEDVSDTITFSTDNDQSLMTETSGVGTVTTRATGSGNANLLTGSGNINLTSTSGNINIGTSGSGQLNLGTVTSGTWNGTAIGDAYLTKTGNWTGTLDGYEASQLLDDAFSTTSASYFLSQNQGNAFSTTSTINFIHSSTTIPKLYSSNTWTGSNVFNSLTLGTLNGPLHANAGVVSATSSIGVLYGGTGLTNAPAYGQLLVGNASGGYTLTATSSLGISTSLFTDGGATTYLTSSDNLGLGTTTANSKLTVYGDLFLEGTDRYTNFGTTTGTNGYGFRDNAGVMEFKNANGVWQGVTTATTGPSFSVHKNGTNQTVTAGVITLVTWSHESFDTNNNFASNRFTPTVPGKYILSAATYCNAACSAYIYKNGSAVSQHVNTSSGASLTSHIVDMNGSTDYVEVYVFNNSTSVFGTAVHTYFSGAMIAPVNGNNAAGWANDGSASFLLDNADRVGIGTTSPNWKLSVAGDASFDSFARASYFMATSSTASVLPFASTTAITVSGTASTTNLYVSSAGGTAGCATFSSAGLLSNTGVACGSGSSDFPFTPSTFGATAVNSTSTALQLTGGLFASSTVRFGNAGVDNFLFDSATGRLGLGTTTPSATLTVHGDTLFNGTDRYTNFGTTTGSSGYGFRDNGGVIEFKNANGTWQGVTTATTGPSFSVHKNGSDQTIAAGGAVLLTWPTEVFDTNNNFASNRFTPTVPGKYLIRAQAWWTNTIDAGGNASMMIYKNGSLLTQVFNYPDVASAQRLTNSIHEIVDMNGTTDYIEIYVSHASAGSEVVNGSASLTNFSGIMIAPVNGNNAAGWANDGSASFLLDNADRVGIGTTTPWAKLAIQGDSGQLNPVFEVASSSTATKFLSVSSTGFGTTTLSGLNISGSATSTSNVGMDITSGCYAVGGVCLSGGASLTGIQGQLAYFSGSNTAVGTSTLFIDTSSRVGIGTSTPTQSLSVWGNMEIGDGTGDNSILAYNTGRTNFGSLDLYNGSTGNVTLSTSFSTGDIILSPGASGFVGIGTTTPTAMLTVYGDTLFNGTDRYTNFGTTTGSSGYGFRDNAGVMEFKNAGGAWQGVTTATTGPSFSVHKNGTNQTVVASTYTLMTWETEVFDTNNNFNLATERFTPTVPGKYLISAQAYCSNSGASGCEVDIYKNGSVVNGGVGRGTAAFADVTAVIDMNGSTDYIEAYVANVGGTTISGVVEWTFFTGTMIAPVNGNNAAGWANDGSASFLLDNADKVGIGTTTPWAKLAIQASGAQTNPLFEIASSSFATKFLTVAGDGFGTTTLSGLNISGSATSTSNVGMNLTSGCYAVGGVCLSGDSSSGYPFSLAGNATSTLTQFNGGLTAYASSTIGAGGQTTGLTVSGGATTTGSLYVGGNVGIGTASPSERLQIFNSSTARLLVGDATRTLQTGVDGDVGAHYGLRGGNGIAFADAGDLIPIAIDAAGATTFPDSNSALGRSTIRWGSLWVDGLSVTGGNVGVGTTSPLAALSSYGDLFLDGADRYVNFGATSTLGVNGYGFRDNAGVMEFKNANGTWQGVTTATTGPSFSVHKGGSSQTVTTNTWTQIVWSTEIFDTNNNFDLSTERFTPTVPGKYMVSLAARCVSTTARCLAGIYKNGSPLHLSQSEDGSNSNPTAVVTAVIDMNGTTDYLEGYGFNGGGTSIDGDALQTYFSGIMIAPVNGNNAAGWANDGTSSFLLDNADSVGIGTTTPWAKLAIQGDSGQLNPVFEVASSSTATKFLSVSSTGFGTTTLSGLNISGSATSTSNVGFDISGGCYAVGGVCLSSGSSLSGTTGQLAYFSGTDTAVGTSTLFISTAENVGIGTTTPWSKLALYGDLFIEGSDRYLNFGTATGTDAYGIRDNAGTLEFKNSGGAWTGIGTGSGTGGARLTAVHTYTSDTTWNKPDDLDYVIVKVVGAGGGGGGSGTTANRGGAGGGGGGYSQERIDASDLGSSETVTVGEAGAAQTGTGLTGETSSFGSYLQATGGAGGSSAGGGNGGAGGVGSGGDVNIEGSDGQTASVQIARGGHGGDSHLGGGGSGGQVDTAGLPGNSYGGGGGGSPTTDASQSAGAAGAHGVVIVYEYSQTDDTQKFTTSGITTSLATTSDYFAVGTSTAYSKLTAWGGASGNIFEAVTSASTTALLVSGTGNIGIGTTSPWAKLAINSTAGMPQFLIGSSTTQFIVDESGNVGVGTTSPSRNLTVAGTSHFTSSMYIGIGDENPVINNVAGFVLSDVGILNLNRSAGTPAHFGRSNDGTIVSFYSAGDAEGSISVSGSTVSYNAFTGSHYGTTDESVERGMLVELDGTQTFKYGDSDSEPTYGVQKTTAANSPAVFGSLLSLMEPLEPHEALENPYLIMAVGNGDIWVVQGEEETIEPGDYLISSNLAGHAMKDPETYMVSHIVARAAQRVDWGAVASTTADGLKRMKISVTFEQFDRNTALSNVLAAMATSTASSTDASEVEGFADAFMTNLFSRMTSWLADAGNGITEIFVKTLRAENVYADTVNANMLCLEDLCVTKAELQQMLNQSNTAPATVPEEDPTAPENEPIEEPESETPTDEPDAEDSPTTPDEQPTPIDEVESVTEAPQEEPEASAEDPSAEPTSEDSPDEVSADDATSEI